MSNRKNILITGAVVSGGALLSLFYLVVKTPPGQALLLGYFNAMTLTVTLLLLQKLLLVKLTVFSTAQQWLLKSFIYTILACFVFLAGLLFQYLVFNPITVAGAAVIDKLWQGVILLIAEPQHRDFAFIVQTREFRTIVIPFFALFFLFGLGGVVGSYIEIRWQGEKHARISQKAQLTALQAQIEPHFLFNSLNTIAAAIRSDPQRAENLVLKLSDLFRYIFENSGRDTNDLDHEIAFAREYLELLKARYGDLLKVEWRQNLSSIKQMVPVFLIQPVLENSIRHGWPSGRQRLEITVDIQENEQGIIIDLKDNGSGMKPGLVRQATRSSSALGNISERLRLLYNNRAGMEITSAVSEGTRVRFVIPKGQS